MHGADCKGRRGQERDIEAIQTGEPHTETGGAAAACKPLLADRTGYKGGKIRKEIMGLYRRAFGKNHWETLQAMQDLADFYERTRQAKKEEKIRKETESMETGVQRERLSNARRSTTARKLLFAHGKG